MTSSPAFFDLLNSGIPDPASQDALCPRLLNNYPSLTHNLDFFGGKVVYQPFRISQIKRNFNVELLSLPRRCGQHGVSTNGDGECHLDAFHPLPMHNLGRFGNQSTVEEPYNGGKPHAISDTEFGGVGLGVYRGFVSLTVAPKLDSPKISSGESVESSSRMPGSQVRLWRFLCNKPHFL